MPQDRDTGPDAARVAAHAGIEHLMDTLLPSLIAKLATLNVGELEVREGDWHVRLRHPMSAGQDFGRRATDRSGQRAHAGHEAVGAPAPARALATGVIAGATTAAPNGSLPALSPEGLILYSVQLPNHAARGLPGTPTGKVIHLDYMSSIIFEVLNLKYVATYNFVYKSYYLNFFYFFNNCIVNSCKSVNNRCNVKTYR